MNLFLMVLFNNHFIISKKHIPTNKNPHNSSSYGDLLYTKVFNYFFIASSIATATATVAPTIGLLPMPRKPIIST